ncbi:hypothetical protein GQ44DRAFT_832403 [Phaeosphaeriaceae sp. PMI808]|nr:hypothetical protein GQ44DRAFT_832403 [Phaeosphaeriaceae sp. PMI808]
MRFTAIATTFFLIAGALAAPAPEAWDVNDSEGTDVTADLEKRAPTAVEIMKRGHGCGVFSSDDGICNFHCKNEVTYKCPNGKVIKPSSGKCGGPLGARCDCHYSKGC